jgi:hypothetical protein
MSRLLTPSNLFVGAFNALPGVSRDSIDADEGEGANGASGLLATPRHSIDAAAPGSNFAVDHAAAAAAAQLFGGPSGPVGPGGPPDDIAVELSPPAGAPAQSAAGTCCRSPEEYPCWPPRASSVPLCRVLDDTAAPRGAVQVALRCAQGNGCCKYKPCGSHDHEIKFCDGFCRPDFGVPCVESLEDDCGVDHFSGGWGEFCLATSRKRTDGGEPGARGTLTRAMCGAADTPPPIKAVRCMLCTALLPPLIVLRFVATALLPLLLVMLPARALYLGGCAVNLAALHTCTIDS